MTKPPPPLHILRLNKAQVSALSFSEDNEILYTADQQGYVAMVSTRTMRPVAFWRAHTDALLGVEEWDQFIVTHGRDNKLHVWERPVPPVEVVNSVEQAFGTPQSPNLKYSMDVNALNFCRFSLFKGPPDEHCLVAVPNLVDSAFVDIWNLTTQDRLHAAIGKQHLRGSESSAEADLPKLGICMSTHLFGNSESIRVLVSYEDGSVALYARKQDQSMDKTIEGTGWERVWRCRHHTESVMALAVAFDGSFAISVSADHLLARYETKSGASTVCQSKYPGNGSVAIRKDGRVCAIGGWDGSIRLYGTKNFKALGTLAYHKQGCYALAFSNQFAESDPNNDDEDLSTEEKAGRRLWLASGGKDSRVCIWPLSSFSK